MSASSRLDEIKDRMNQKTTEELTAIWTENDRHEWADDAFPAIKEVLVARGASMPAQKEWPRKTPPPDKCATTSKPPRKLLWFYIGAAFMATMGNSSMGLTNLPILTRWGCTAVALAYCLTVPRLLSLGTSTGIAFLAAIVGLVASISVASFAKAAGTPSPVLGILALLASIAAAVFYFACMMMVLGLIFYGIAKGIGKLSKKKQD